MCIDNMRHEKPSRRSKCTNFEIQGRIIQEIQAHKLALCCLNVDQLKLITHYHPQILIFHKLFQG